MKKHDLQLLLCGAVLFFLSSLSPKAQVDALPPAESANRPFTAQDREAFYAPQKVYYPETWFHYIGGNVAREGITQDLEAIAGAGISGIQFFHGQFGGPWPGVEPQIKSLSPHWDDAVRHTAEECRRLGLRFTMQNCSGWATSGGPWIEPENAMRHLVWSRTDVSGGTAAIELPLPSSTQETWRDYRDITVLAFPTPLDDTGRPLLPKEIKSNADANWEDLLSGNSPKPLRLKPAPDGQPHWVEVTFPQATVLRAVEFSSINGFNHPQCYEPEVAVGVQVLLPDGYFKDVIRTDLPQANSQDNRPFTLACSDVRGAKTYRISIANKHNMTLSSLRLFSAARKNNWESEAGWTLRSIERNAALPMQDEKAFIHPAQMLDLSSRMDKDGKLNWKAPAGKWTILRIGHVNTGRRNSPAPPEGTGWECNKLAPSGAEAQFAGYIGRLIRQDGALADGLLNGMLIDSWECETQTWTENMEKEFRRVADYPLRKWLPAVFGYVVTDHETTARFLRDWRATINDLFSRNFYGRMTELAHEKGLDITYETAAGDVFPGDILEYYKFADVPMCEFWQPMTKNFVGSSNYKPIKPAASAARLYGKPRLAAEAFTSFDLTWDEHLSMLKEVANVNYAEGVTHLVFHTYTHNPQRPFLPPGTSFGAGIGTPFLRGQTWWKYMPEFTTYLSRCSYLLERGKPVSDVLWYLGDEINHKPDQNAPFPEGFKYDYCNPDILLTRLAVSNGRIVTPEGISYRVLWLPETYRMLPETVERIYELVRAGATVVGNPPEKPATLSEGSATRRRFNKAVKKLWGKDGLKGRRQVGRGWIISHTPLAEALKELNMTPDVTGGDVLWSHRRAEGADWYFVSSPKGKGFKGTLDFRACGYAELWDPVTGQSIPAPSKRNGDRTSVELNLPRAGACFVVFHQADNYQPQKTVKKQTVSTRLLSNPWTLSFPSGWGAPASLQLTGLKPWKELDMSAEGKAFSGTAVYRTTFEWDKMEEGSNISLDLGEVEMIASVSVNGKTFRPLWAPPYRLDITEAVKTGENKLTIEVTGTWFNRLVFDAGQPQEQRKTWTINGPSKEAPLRNSGLLGPVSLSVQKDEQTTLAHFTEIEKQFKGTPSEVQSSIYWYWINNKPPSM